MPDLTILQRAVADVSWQIRVRRAEFYGLRGLFGGAVVALLPLVLRDSLLRASIGQVSVGEAGFLQSAP